MIKDLQSKILSGIDEDVYNLKTFEDANNKIGRVILITVNTSLVIM
jgi:hypothetical protein